MDIQFLRSTLVISLCTSVARVLGLARDHVLARFFGAGEGMDIFLVAFRIPNFLRRIFAEGGFNPAFVPVLVEYKERRSEAEVRALIDHTASVLSLVLFGVTVLGVLAAPVLIAVFAPGFIGDGDKAMRASEMLRLMFPYIFFISLTGLCSSILNSYKQFAVPALMPILLNLSLIGGALWLAPMLEEPIKALAWAVLLAGMIQLLFQLPFLYRMKKLPRPALTGGTEGGKQILRLMLPSLFAISIVQINLMIDTMIASFLQTGSITWLYFSSRLVEYPMGVFGIALATVILPSLSKQHALGIPQHFSDMLEWGLKWALLIMLPATAGLIVLSGPLLVTLFQYNEFKPHDVEMARQSLIAYSFGLSGFALIKILSAGFFSRQDTRTPVKTAVVAMLLNIVLNLILVVPLAHAGLALATSLSSCTQAAILYYLLKKEGVVLTTYSAWLKFLLQLSAAALLMFGLLSVFQPELSLWQNWSAPKRLILLLGWTVTGIACYFSALWLLGLRYRHMSRGL